MLHQAFEELGIGRPILVAHSAGTQVALAYALQFARQLRGLVLLSGYYYPTMRGDLLLLAPPAIPLVGTLLRHTISPIVGRLLWPAWLKLLFDPLPVRNICRHGARSRRRSCARLALRARCFYR